MNKTFESASVQYCVLAETANAYFVTCDVPHYGHHEGVIAKWYVDLALPVGVLTPLDLQVVEIHKIPAQLDASGNALMRYVGPDIVLQQLLNRLGGGELIHEKGHIVNDDFTAFVDKGYRELSC